MSNPITLTAIARDKEFILNWNHFPVEGESTRYTTISWTNNIDTYLHTATIYDNPSNGKFVLDEDAATGVTYVVQVIQSNYRDDGAYVDYVSNTLTLHVKSVPDALTLKENDIGTINDLRFITLKVYRDLGYSSGYSALVQIKFTAYDGNAYRNYSFGPEANDIYTLTDLPPNQNYEITAKAVNDVGPSLVSNTIIEETSGHPQMPRDFKIVTSYSADLDTNISLLTWKRPTNAELTNLTGYIIRYRLSGHDDDSAEEIVLTALDTDAEMSYPFNFNTYVPDAVPNQTYIFKIMSRNELDRDPIQSNSTYELTAHTFKPSLPVQSLAVVPKDKSLALSWNSPSDVKGYSLNDYVVKVYTGADTTTLFNTYEPVGNTLEVPGLENYVKTRVEIYPRTLNTATSLLSLNDGTITTGTNASIDGESTTSLVYYPYKLADKVTGLAGVPSNNSVILNWVAPEDTGGFPIDHYVVLYKVVNGSTWESVDVFYAELPKTIAAINGTDVEYIVTPVTRNINPGANPVLLSGASETITRRAYTKPNPITNLQVILSDSRIKLLFSPSSDGGGYPIIQYKISHKLTTSNAIEYNDNEIFINTADIVWEDGFIKYEFDALTNGDGYDFKIAVINGVPGGVGNKSDDVTESNQIPYKASTGVINFVVEALDTKLYANWETPEFPGGFQIDHYDIYLNNSIVPHDTTNNTTTDYLFEGLTNGTNYDISIVPVTINGLGDKVDGMTEAVLATKPFTTPDAVTNFIVVEKDKELVLSWNPPANDGADRGDGGNDIVGYSVKMFDNITGGELHSYTVGANVLTYTFNVTNVPAITNGNRYTLKCKALTKTVSDVQLESVDAEIIDAQPYGKPLSINYSIANRTITVTMANNGSPITDVLICAPLAANASVSNLASILVSSSSSESAPINPTGNPLFDEFITIMSYDLNPSESQPMLIVATNPAGMIYVENFADIASGIGS